MNNKYASMDGHNNSNTQAPVAAAENPFDTASIIRDDSSSTYPPAPAGFKKYLMYYTTSRMHCRLHLGSKSSPPAYYLETNISLTNPQLLLRRGDSKQAPMVAFCKMPALSWSLLLGKGDYKTQAKPVWEELSREKNSLHRSDYLLATAEGSVGGGETGEKTKYRWRKDKSKKLKTVYECVAEGDGRVVARMFSGGALNFNKGGEIEVVEGLSQGLEETLLMSASSIWAVEALKYQSILQGFEKGKGEKKD
ncbi:hypothetical protein F4778DRAFT_716083 [Xylariomycetidae sp. FL2044]|nr:hypothetical protein F4778DRAFT_716083 [Xylariomycetidae sp. FL2044]